jgi:hypothetical protein
LVTKPGPLEDRDVLLDRREAHGVVTGQLGDPLLAVDRTAHDVAAGVVRQGAEHAIEIRRVDLHGTTIRLYSRGCQAGNGPMSSGVRDALAVLRRSMCGGVTGCAGHGLPARLAILDAGMRS